MPINPLLNPDHVITSVADLRAKFPPTHPIAVVKCLDHLDIHARDFISRAPFLCIGTQDADGTADVSPRGDPPGFVYILDDKTLAIPDRRGNNRLDTQANIITNPSVSLLFMIPGYDETMRINGQAEITCDPDLLARMAVNGKAPSTAIVVTVSEMFIHCAKAFRRSKLWDPEHRQNRKDMPSLMKIVLDQTSGAPDDPKEMTKLDEDLEESYRTRLY